MNPDVFREINIPTKLQTYFRRILVGQVTEPIQMEVEPRATGYAYLSWIAQGRWTGFVNDVLEIDSDTNGRVILSGQIDNASIITRFEGPLWQVFAEFNALGQQQFLGIPGIETLERAVGPQSLNSAVFKSIDERLSKFQDDASHEQLQQHFLQVLESTPEQQVSIPEYLHNGINKIEQCNGFCRIAEIAKIVGTSERQFRREFVQAVGLKPKNFCNVLQVNTALALLMNREDSKIAELATECGFVDQAHLTRAFQKFLGASPLSLAANAEATVARFVGQCRAVENRVS
ncbi:MAG: helix-turn-helix transcriptional regulator [Gammaproteobacteria bacterium]|nr:helix-turn-helix transcriptional regulator [Gammaproteobacteria bacterium]